MKLLLSLLLLSTIGGQLIRIPYLQGTGILATDFILGIIVLFWLIKLITKQTKINFNLSNNLFLVFLGTTFFSLLINLPWLPNRDAIISLFYFLRFLAYTSLFFIFQDLQKESKYFFNLTLLTTFILVILGFLQLKFFPNFEVLRMQEKGWDPHIGRLLSTWFDPNFLGGFFAFILCLLASKLIQKYNQNNFFKFLEAKENLIYLGLFGLIFIGLFLTYSRSAYLAFLIGLFLIGAIASRKLLVIGFIVIILIFSASSRLQSRVIDAYESAQALLNKQSVYTLDASAKFRYQSWRDAFTLYKEKPILGHGYNTLRYIQAKRGYTEWKSHASGGIDSSLLTILVTTGSIGLILFLVFFFSLLCFSFKSYKKNNQALGLGYFTGLIALLVHSFFVNSLLFPFIMIFYWSFGGLLLKDQT